LKNSNEAFHQPDWDDLDQLSQYADQVIEQHDSKYLNAQVAPEETDEEIFIRKEATPIEIEPPHTLTIHQTKPGVFKLDQINSFKFAGKRPTRLRVPPQRPFQAEFTTNMEANQVEPPRLLPASRKITKPCSNFKQAVLTAEKISSNVSDRQRIGDKFVVGKGPWTPENDVVKKQQTIRAVSKEWEELDVFVCDGGHFNGIVSGWTRNCVHFSYNPLPKSLISTQDLSNEEFSKTLQYMWNWQFPQHQAKAIICVIEQSEVKKPHLHCILIPEEPLHPQGRAQDHGGYTGQIVAIVRALNNQFVKTKKILAEPVQWQVEFHKYITYLLTYLFKSDKTERDVNPFIMTNSRS
jgi:hypothetical protein